MAQIIKHRRGRISQLKGTAARNGELIIASGSIDDLQGPFVFIGSPVSTDEGIAGAFNSVSRIYQGTAAPTITAGTYGSVLDGTPFYASGNKSLYILNNSNGGGNSKIDLTGNIEGNTISGVTINNLQSTNVTASFVSGAFVGDASGLYNIPATGVTGLNLSKIYSGSVQVSTDPNSGITLSGGTINMNNDVYVETDAHLYHDGVFIIEDNNNGVTINSTNYSQLQSGDAWLWLENGSANLEAQSIDIYSQNGPFYITNNTSNSTLEIKSRNNGTVLINNETGNSNGDVHILSGEGNKLYVHGQTQIDGDTSVTGSMNVNGNTSVTGSLVVTDGAAFIDQGVVSQNSNVLLTSGSNLIIQNGGNANIAGNLYVTGSETVDYIQGYTQQWNYLALNGGAIGAPDVELASHGNISLWAEGGTVNVTGSMRVTGDIIFSGSINLGDYTGDTINFNGEVSSNVLPTTGATFDLGSSGQTWNNIWAENAHFNNISLDTISFSGLTTDRVVIVGDNGSLVDNGNFTFTFNNDYNNNVLSAPIINATSNGNGTNFLIGDDMWLGDINESNATRFMGAQDNNVAKIYLGSQSTNNQLYSNYGDVTLQSDNTLYLQSQNSNVNINAYDGNLSLNTDSNNNISIGGNTYINNGKELFASYIRDNNNNNNYIQLYGYGTDDGYWWESGTGADTTLLNRENNSNLNIVNTNNGNVNIDATGGSVNLHSNNGFNVTGSMIVSDGSGVFNSYLIANNSDLTLEGGSDIHMNDSAHLYFDTCVDIYWDNGNGNLVFYNDCNNFQFRNNVSITGSLNVSSGLNTDNIYGATNNSNALHLNGGILGAPNVELSSGGQISLFSEGGGSDYAINMTGSVNLTDSLGVTGSAYFRNDVYLNNNNTLYSNYIGDFEGNDLHINTVGTLYLTSTTDRTIEISAANDEDGTNYIVTDNTGIKLQTYDYTSDLTHIVKLDNLGNLDITNVNVHISGSLGVDGNTIYNNDLTVEGNMYVSGNFSVLGSGSTIHLSSSQVDIGTNIINLNTYAPFERFAGISVYDSGSNAGVTGSLLWDSLNNVWIYANPSGSAYASARFISGPKNSGSLGEESGLTNGHIPMATGDDHISDSPLTYVGTTLALNTNKFTIDSDSGDTVILGNFTIQGVGGTDNGEASSFVVFRNSDDVLGFVNTEDTTSETSQLMGYETSTGNLVFSSLIDGGTY